MPDNENIIRFVASIYKVQTLVDGGIRINLDLPETAIDAAAAMMRAKQAGAVIEVAAIAINKNNIQETNVKSQLGEGNQRKSTWQTEEIPRADNPA
jgi:hypothetical protein